MVPAETQRKEEEEEERPALEAVFMHGLDGVCRGWWCSWRLSVSRMGGLQRGLEREREREREREKERERPGPL